MKGHNDQVEQLRKIGYVTRDEAAQLTGRVSGGTNHELFVKSGVRFISIPMGENGKECRVYLREDLDKVPRNTAESIPGRESNGGKLMHEIKELRERVEALESWKRAYES